VSTQPIRPECGREPGGVRGGHQELQFTLQLHVFGVEILREKKPADLGNEFDCSILFCDFNGAEKKVDKSRSAVDASHDLDARRVQVFFSCCGPEIRCLSTGWSGSSGRGRPNRRRRWRSRRRAERGRRLRPPSVPPREREGRSSSGLRRAGRAVYSERAIASSAAAMPAPLPMSASQFPLARRS
jgi:hypothetical protein